MSVDIETGSSKRRYAKKLEQDVSRGLALWKLGEGIFAATWKWLRVKMRDRNARLGLRVTVAAVAAFILAQVFTAPLAGLWAVLTAVLVTQTNVGASLTATVEYFVGTLEGAVYAVAIAVLVPPH